MPNATITVNYRRPFAPQLGSNPLTANGTPSIIDWAHRFLAGVNSGAIEADFFQWNIADDVAVGSNAYTTPACAMLVVSGGAGAIGGTIGGTLVTGTWVSDVTAGNTIATAIRANTTVNRFVTASARECRVTLASVVAGTTVRIFGQVFTAVATAGAIAAFGDYNIDGADAADATALALAINRHPSLAGRVVAVANGAAVSIFLVEDRAPAASECITNPSAATITVNVASPTQGARCAVIANVGGPIGNFVTATASGTGVTIVTAGTVGQLGGGTGGATPAGTWRGVP